MSMTNLGKQLATRYFISDESDTVVVPRQEIGSPPDRVLDTTAAELAEEGIAMSFDQQQICLQRKTESIPRCLETFGEFACALKLDHAGPHEADLATQEDIRKLREMNPQVGKAGWLEWTDHTKGQS